MRQTIAWLIQHEFHPIQFLFFPGYKPLLGVGDFYAHLTV